MNPFARTDTRKTVTLNINSDLKTPYECYYRINLRVNFWKRAYFHCFINYQIFHKIYLSIVTYRKPVSYVKFDSFILDLFLR